MSHYTAVGRNLRLGPMSAEALSAELKKRQSDPATITIILHHSMGDRSGPAEHFPELALTEAGTAGAAYSPSRYHTLWLRFIAGVIDLIVVAPFLVYVLMVAPPTFAVSTWAFSCAMVAGSSAYFVVLHAKYGQTLGKRLMGVRVVHVADEGSISLRQSLSRETPLIAINLFLLAMDAAVIVVGPEQAGASLAMLYAAVQPLPNLWFFADAGTTLTNRKRRSLHDHIGNTVVVRGEARKRVSPPTHPAIVTQNV